VITRGSRRVSKIDLLYNMQRNKIMLARDQELFYIANCYHTQGFMNF